MDEAAVEADVRDELAREGVMKLASVKPAAIRGKLVAKLAADGFEVTKAAVRRPLLAQLKEALAHGALVPVKSLNAHVRGGSAPELKQLVTVVVRDGVAKLVQRGAVEVLASREARVLSVAEVQSLRERLADLGKALEKVTKKKGLSFLTSDATAVLSGAVSALEEREVSAARRVSEGAGALAGGVTSHEEEMRALLEAVEATKDERTGLSFVPAVVGRLAPGLSSSVAVKLLLSAAERELLELRPEGGIGRLTQAELLVCPPGPHDTRLSWTRRLPGEAT